jgi:L-threonylcarbamoyladenylate synthase
VPSIVRIDPTSPDAHALAGVARQLRDGLVVAFPTDTLYGLAVDPRNPDAIARLFALKGRDATAAVPLVAATLDQAMMAAEFGDVHRRLAARWWPGPLTIVAPARPGVARDALGGGSTVGVRVPDHAVARALAEAVGFSVTATSANRSGTTAAVRASEVIAALPDVDVVIDAGPARGGPPSTIVQVVDGGVRLVREGAVAWERVLESLG